MILFAGDSHGSYRHMRYLYVKAVDFNIKHVIIAGDFGYWPYDNEAKNTMFCLNNLLKDKDIKFYFVDGNHEDYNELLKLNQYEISEIPYCNNCFYIPRGCIVEIDDRNILGFGGAISIDREYRIAGKTWFKEEAITDEQIDDFVLNFRLKQKKIDIMVSHDAPLNLLTDDYKNDPISDLHRQQIQRIIMVAKPDILVHGHYHHLWHYVYRDTACIGLDCNLNPRESYAVI